MSAFRIFTLLLLSLCCSAQTLSVLHTFTGKSDGAYPYGGVVMDRGGKLYGTTSTAGLQRGGTVYEVDRTGHFKLLHAFVYHDGCSSLANLLIDSSGDLYGTNSECGSHKFGTAFKLTPSGQLFLLTAFDGLDSAKPAAGLIRDPISGDLYGTGSSVKGGVKKDQRGGAKLTHLFSFLA